MIGIKYIQKFPLSVKTEGLVELIIIFWEHKRETESELVAFAVHLTIYLSVADLSIDL